MQTKIRTTKAIRLIDEQIAQFQKLMENASVETLYGRDYQVAKHDTDELLTELFSSEEAYRFFSKSPVPLLPAVNEITEEETRQYLLYMIGSYREHIKDLMNRLEVYKRKIEKYWPDDSDSSSREKMPCRLLCKDEL